GDLPTVLSHVEYPARVDMPLSRLQRPFNHPDPMEFIARQLWVNVALPEDIAVCDAVTVEPISVIGDIKFPLAHQLPLEAVRGAVEETHFVDGLQIVRVGDGKVIGRIR